MNNLIDNLMSKDDYELFSYDSDDYCKDHHCEYNPLDQHPDYNHKKCANCKKKVECGTSCAKNCCYYCCDMINNLLTPDKNCIECNNKYHSRFHCITECPNDVYNLCLLCYYKKQKKDEETEKLIKIQKYLNSVKECKLCKKKYSKEIYKKYDDKHCGKCFKIINIYKKTDDEYLKMKKYFKDNNINLQ